MKKKKIGFIGTRNIEEVPKDKMSRLNELLHEYTNPNEHLISTGGAWGVDQYCAEYALRNRCEVLLCLPWFTYAEEWINTLGDNQLISKLVYYPSKHPYALDSVFDNHPNAHALKPGAIALHARNYLIVEDCYKVIALPSYKYGKPSGGTAHGIRLCKSMGIDLLVI